jgi:ADP-ribosylation factor-binding protein GGA
MSAFSSFSSPPGSQSITPQPPSHQPAAFQPPAAAPAASTADPFAALTGTPASQSSKGKAPANNDDDEWNFASSLPPTTPGKPKEQRATLNSTGLRVDWVASRSKPGANSLTMAFAFSNNLAQPVSELHFQLAVTKVRSLPPSYSFFR